MDNWKGYKSPFCRPGHILKFFVKTAGPHLIALKVMGNKESIIMLALVRLVNS